MLGDSKMQRRNRLTSSWVNIARNSAIGLKRALNLTNSFCSIKMPRLKKSKTKFIR